MTRFKDLRRLEDAIKNANEEELKWADAWCKRRFSMATMKHHQRHWRKLMKRVDTAIAELDA
jgi:hypothetical protein